jgi:hypothetical protein
MSAPFSGACGDGAALRKRQRATVEGSYTADVSAVKVRRLPAKGVTVEATANRACPRDRMRIGRKAYH